MKPHYDLNLYFNDKTTDGNGRLKDLQYIERNNLWATYGKSWQLNDEEYKGLGLPIVSSSKVDLTDKTIYRFPKLDLPRQKVDLLKEKYNCKVTRIMDRADVCVVSHKFFDTMFTREWHGSRNFAQVFRLFKYMKDQNLITDESLVTMREILEKLTRDTMFKINLHHDWNNGTPSHNNYLLVEKFLNTDFMKVTQSDFIISNTNAIAYQNIINCSSKLVLDTDICDIIDEDLAIISNDEYDRIESMIQSDDIDNRSLAVEMLANCNINKSFDVVSGVYYWNFDWFKNTNNWNSVNVKAFRKRMKNYEGGRCTTNIYSFNNFIKKLAEDRKLTKFAVDHTRNKLYNTLLKDLVGSSSKVFKIDLDSLLLDEELTENII